MRIVALRKDEASRLAVELRIRADKIIGLLKRRIIDACRSTVNCKPLDHSVRPALGHAHCVNQEIRSGAFARMTNVHVRSLRIRGERLTQSDAVVSIFGREWQYIAKTIHFLDFIPNVLGAELLEMGTS